MVDPKAQMEIHPILGGADDAKVPSKCNQSRTKVRGEFQSRKGRAAASLNATAGTAAVLPADAIYLLLLEFGVGAGTGHTLHNLTVKVEWATARGYLSAVDWPLLPFYGVMCAVYAIYAAAWLCVSCLNWKVQDTVFGIGKGRRAVVEGAAADPVLDLRSDHAGDAGEGPLLRRVPDAQRHRLLRPRRHRGHPPPPPSPQLQN